jgi:hypothetical protein
VASGLIIVGEPLVGELIGGVVMVGKVTKNTST